MTRTVRIQIVAATAFWAAVSALYTGNLFWQNVQMGARGAPLHAVLWSGSLFLYWAPLTVLIWQLTRRWTPAALGWPRFLGQHLLVAFGAAAIHNTIIALGNLAVFAPPNENFRSMFAGGMRGRAPLELISYTGVVATGLAVSIFERWRDRDAQAARLEAELATSRLAALQQQMQPHFLFNSLHAIASLARDGRSADVVQMVANLSELLRTLSNQSATTQPLSAEVELTRRYLEIQQVRFGDRLKFEFDVAPDTLALHVPALTLQPLVDNAIRHGITPAVSGGAIRVRAARHGKLLQLKVDDNGVGVPPGWALTSGTGIRNLQSRLSILYGDRATVAVNPSLESGFAVVVTLPASDSAPAL